MRLFSSRRESITADLRARAAQFEQRYGRAPSQRELARLAQASNFKTRNPKHGALDIAQLHADWADKLTRTLGVNLASVAPSVWHEGGAGARSRGPGHPGPAPVSELELSEAAQKAVALAQQEKSTWTRAALVKYLGRVLPRSGRDPAAAGVLLEDLADRALRSEFEPVACLEAPEPAEVPRSLLRADGRSIYQRHGGVRYATHAQLSLEERMLALARATGAPRMTRADAARTLGADLAQLEAALAGRAQDVRSQRMRTGLREDQAAAALAVLTDGRRVSVINAPAGSGKTWVLAAAGQAWAAAGLGRVIGITPSQSARNTLSAGVLVSYNAAQFLGHLAGQRGARGPIRLQAGDLILIDEASMVATPDLADVITHAATVGAKVILAGDTQQLQAVENGGGMSLLADALGYTQLTEPGPVPRRLGTGRQPAAPRRRHQRAGRVRPAGPHLRRRARADDGRRRGRLRRADPGRHGHPADGRRPRGNHRRRRHGQPGGPDHLHPQRPHCPGGGARPDPGQRRPSPDRRDHPQGPGRAPRTGRRPGHRAAPLDRPTLLVQLLSGCRAGLRGHQPRRAGPHRDRRAGRDHRRRGPPARPGRPDPRHHHQPGLRLHPVPEARQPRPRPRPAPELARYDNKRAERSGVPAPPISSAPPGQALAVLAAVLDRDGQLLSATQDRHRALANADHLAILHAIWTAETTPAREQRYKNMLSASLPPGYHRPPGHQARWLWRTLRAAELAGLDPAQLLAAAIAERDLAGSRDLAAVIDARLRHRLGTAVPLPVGPWSGQVPALTDTERRSYLAEIATLMDARKDRIGEHVADHAPPWAVTALGPVPGHPLDRLNWQRRASSIGAWRELSGYDDPADPIGPEPVAAAPDLRAAWHEALAALGPSEGPDVRGMPDGLLLHLRDTYPLETAWAPQYVGDELRQVRAAAWDARLAAVRATAEADRPASRPARRSRPAAGPGLRLPGHARRLPGPRSYLRRRHGRPGRLGRRHPPPAPPSRRCRHRTPPTPPRPQLPATALRRTPALLPSPARRPHPHARGADPRTSPVGPDLTAQRRAFADRLANHQSLLLPAADPDYGDLGQAFPPWPAPARQPILQPPRPEIQPYERILERAADREPDWEASD